MSDKTCFVIAPIGPSFRTVAGAKLMVILPRGRRRALLLSALRTRSLTAVSGKPTTATLPSGPHPACTSISISKASTPTIAAE
jgi:hypothetical protein